MKKEGSGFWDWSIFFLYLSEVSALVFVWSMAFTFEHESIVAIIAATATVIIGLIDISVVLTDKLNEMDHDAKKLTPNMRYKVDCIHTSVEAIQPTLIKIEDHTSRIGTIELEREILNQVLAENKHLVKQHQEDLFKVLELTAENNVLRSENQRLTSSAKKQYDTGGDSNEAF